MKKNEIREMVDVIKCMLRTYDVFYWNSDEHKIMREGLLRELVNKTCVLIEGSITWLKKYRWTSPLIFELDNLFDILLNARFYNTMNEDNLTHIKLAIEYVERSVLDRNV